MFPEQGPRENVCYVRRDPATLAALPEVAALVEAERERCAKVAESSPDSHWGPTIAAAIRKWATP
jgi:hypothetical protein